MKRHLAILITVSAMLVSCSMEDAFPGGDYYSGQFAPDFVGTFNAIATIKKTPSDTVFFQLNDSRNSPRSAEGRAKICSPA